MSQKNIPGIKCTDDLTNMVFGRLTAIEYIGGPKHLWKCQCSCAPNRFKNVRLDNLRYGFTQSCGCLLLEQRINQAKNLAKKATTHGLSKTSGFTSWDKMMQRCYNKKCKDYKWYGAIGITVDVSWHDVTQFLEDIGIRPPQHNLQRFDRKGNYNKDNCYWSTEIKQPTEKSYEFDGKILTLKEWEKEIGIRASLIWNRLYSGWTIEEALTIPVKHEKKYKNHEDFLLARRCEKYGITMDFFKQEEKKQNGKCKICKEKKRLDIDHDHNNNQFRGLICNNCNLGLYRFQDNPDYCIAAADYLKKSIA